MADLVLRVDRVGSTSVLGLAVKPIIETDFAREPGEILAVFERPPSRDTADLPPGVVPHIELAPDYGASGLWWRGGDLVGPVDPASLPISDETRDDLGRWCDAFEATLDQDYPPNSGFASEEAARRFEADGRRLGHKLRMELGSEWRVDYASSQDDSQAPELPPAT